MPGSLDLTALLLLPTLSGMSQTPAEEDDAAVDGGQGAGTGGKGRREKESGGNKVSRDEKEGGSESRQRKQGENKRRSGTWDTEVGIKLR